MKPLLIPLVIALAMTSLVSCVKAPQSAGGINIVASTDVYGSIATAIVGSHASVTSIIDTPSQDPHEFEASARDQLALSRADVVIVNGGGYDNFMDVLLRGAGNNSAEVLRAVDLSGRTETEIAANEHVWYDLDAVRALADKFTETLVTIDSPHTNEYRVNSQRVDAALKTLQTRVTGIAAEHAGEPVMVTEPVPLYLLQALGLRNVTPVAFSTATEDGQGVPPAVVKRVLDLLSSGEIALLVYNEQAEGPETAHLLAAAALHNIPTVPVTETLPAGRDYLSWMSDNITAIEGALT